MYRWQTESPEEQIAFLKATVRLFRRVTGGKEPQLIGFSVPDGNTSAPLISWFPNVTELTLVSISSRLDSFKIFGPSK